MTYRALFPLCICVLFAMFLIPLVQAEEAQGVVSVKQLERQHLGSWTLTAGAGIVTQGSYDTFSSERPAGNYALIVTPPPGAEAVIEVKSGEETKTVHGKTAAGVLSAGGTLTFSVNYTFSRVGSVSVNSMPTGLVFELKTPWDTIRGKTPYLQKGLPEGSYAIQYILPKGCALPRPFSKQLPDGGRIAFEFSPICALLGTGNAAAPKTMQEVSRMSMRAKMAQRQALRTTVALPSALAKTGRREMSLDDPDHCHNQMDARPLKRRD